MPATLRSSLRAEPAGAKFSRSPATSTGSVAPAAEGEQSRLRKTRHAVAMRRREKRKSLRGDSKKTLPMMGQNSRPPTNFPCGEFPQWLK
jgi:hypothetical protein